jgi:hypothetical protein
MSFLQGSAFLVISHILTILNRTSYLTCGITLYSLKDVTVQFLLRLSTISSRLCRGEFLATDSEARVRFPALPEKKVVGLERGPPSLVNTTEELLDRKVAAPV